MQAQESQQPPQSQESEAPLFDSVGAPQADAEQVVRQRNSELEAKRRQIIEAARAKLKQEFRTAQGVEAPAQTPAPQALAPQPVAAPPAQPSNITAEAIAQTLMAQAREAQAARDAAAHSNAELERRAQEAEAKVQRFLADPAEFLQAQNINMDQWNARLLNGGQPTESERLRAEVDARVAPVLEQVNQLKQGYIAEQREKALTELQPVLAKDFPMVEALMGPAATLEAIRERAQAARAKGQTIGQDFAGRVLADMEADFTAKQQAVLRNASVATKLGISVKSPQAVAAVQSPQTLTNRVTSSVSSTPTRPMSDRDRIARGREAAKQLWAKERM